MISIKIKPLSINKCFQGRRFKTKDYKIYEKELMYKLPNKVPYFKRMGINVEVGVNTLFDIDNAIKPLLDILQKKYGFNDRDIYELNVKKVAVKKGNEYINFNIFEIWE